MQLEPIEGVAHCPDCPASRSCQPGYVGRSTAGQGATPMEPLFLARGRRKKPHRRRPPQSKTARKAIYRTATNLAENPKFFCEISPFAGEGIKQRIAVADRA